MCVPIGAPWRINLKFSWLPGGTGNAACAVCPLAMAAAPANSKRRVILLRLPT